ncbi:hypothetical protein ALC62_10865 [Cyphomyrmex costatus]|uniref:CCHC-type domain-containing protein n=1 Tax=Cyphomyrmex costatus TaxID=456900 RepID=A0A151IDD4_9HYME|nr:hypothetical protein ALC62_10865 [Cyphomyrmex costatus]
MEDRLKRLRIRRGQLKALCKRAHNTLSSDVVNELNVAQLLERKAKIEVTWSQFDEIQSEIEAVLDSADTIATHEAERSDFEETYYDITSRFQDLIISRGATATSDAEARSVSTNRNRALAGNLKLPKIDLPSFSGSYEEWYPFHDTFQSLIHRDRSITEIQKFHYLKAALKGKAAELIQSLEMSADNYEQAWQMLIKRYDNKRLIIQKHLRALFELSTISKENFAALRQLVDEVLKHTRALKAMGRPIDSWDDPIIYLVTGKLDHNTNKEWEDTIAGNDIPTLQRLMEFLEHRCRTLEAVNRKGSSVQAQTKAGQAKVSALVSTKAAACQKCKENHQIYSCRQFLELLPEERLNFIREAKLCWNCLKVSSHIAKDCKAGSCKTCGKRHNSLLHIPGNTAETKVSNSSNQITEPTGNSSTSNVAHATMLNVSSQVFLSTAVVNAHDNQGNKRACRILLDSGSQSNFITEDLVQRLGLTVRPIDVSIVGVNHAYSQVKKMAQVQLSSRYYSYNIIINCLVLKKITERLPNVTMDKSIFKIPPNLPIADPNFNQSTDIEVLLGAEIFWNTLCVGQIKETVEHPLLQKTLFGWVLSGRYPGIATPIETVHCNVTTNHLNLERAIERFWQTEQISTTPVLTAEERQCETHYKENHYRAEDGRFVVKLPKLDHNTNKEWEDTIAGNDIPTLQRLMEFLEHRCRTLEAVNRKGSSVQAQTKAGQAKVSALVSTKAAACQKCKENHQIYSCRQFLELLPEERLNFIREAKLCWNCLKVSSHIAKDCKAGSCKTCGKRHNSLLHIPGNTAETKVSNSSNQITEPTGNSSTSNVAHATMLNVSSQVFLSTAVVNAHDNQGNKRACRILLDSGSQSNFITEDLVQRLGLTVRPIDVSIVGVNHAYSQVKKMAQVQLSSRYYSYNIIINCLVLKKITERLPNVTMDKSIFKIPPNLPIADPNFNQSTDIEVLLGAEIFWNTLCVGQIKETVEHPLLQKTLFGWVLSGRYPGIATPIETVHCNVTTNHLNLERAIERFWQTEQIFTTPVLTAEERQCETHYKENHYRAGDGRFVVKLPIRENKLQTLGNSYDIALKRFHALEGRLSRHPELKAAYTQFMQEYIDLGHMNPIKANSQETAISYYMPHHSSSVLQEKERREL